MILLQIILSTASIIHFRNYLIQKRNILMQSSSTDCYTSNVNRNNFTKDKNFNSKLTKMTIYLALCSIILHLTIAISYFVIFLFFSGNSQMAYNFYLLSLFIGYIKYLSNFFFFFNFYQNFRISLKKTFLDFSAAE